MIRKIRVLISICLAATCITIHAPSRAQITQKNLHNFSVGFNTFYGFIFRHSIAMGQLSQSHPWGAEVFVHATTSGRQAWHHAYRFPDIGGAMGWVNFRNSQLGNAFYAIPYFDKPLIQGSRVSLRLKIGAGVAYATHPYHPERNFQNVALSSRFNYALRGDLSGIYYINKQASASVRLILLHFSNGAFKLPNSGINVPVLSIGMQYRLQPEVIRFIQADSATRRSQLRRTSLQLATAFTIKEAGLPGGKKYPGAVLSAYINRQVNSKSALNAGMDGFYNTAIQYLISNDPDVDPLAQPDFKRVGITLGHELFFGRMSMLTQLGIYVYRPYKRDTVPAVYQRYMLKYAVTNRLFAGVALKSHFGTADCVEWQVGVRL